MGVVEQQPTVIRALPENHLTKVVIYGGRRIMDRIGIRNNMCGAALTVLDVSATDLSGCKTAVEVERWLRCVKCRAIYAALKAGRR